MSLKHAILGFLELEPTTGYTLQQRFAGSVGAFWTATQSQIYRELHALEADGQLAVEVVPQKGRPPRKVYALTPSGRNELRRWLREASPPMQLRDPLLLKLVFASQAPPDEIDQVLAQHEAELELRQVEYQARLRAPEIFALARSMRERVLWELSIENGLAWCTAQLQWTREARRRLDRIPPRRKRK